MKIKSFLLYSLLVFNVCAMENESNEEGVPRNVPYIFTPSDVEGGTITFGTREDLKEYLVFVSRTKEWEKLKPKPDEDMNAYMEETPCFILEEQTRFALVEENSYGIWDDLLSSLPHKKFTKNSLIAEVNRIVMEAFKKLEKELNDPSMGFMLTMEASLKSSGFVAHLTVPYKRSLETQKS